MNNQLLKIILNFKKEITGVYSTYNSELELSGNGQEILQMTFK